MNLADLKAFVAVAETGSINRAAAKLNLTQPAVTRRVQSFEAAVGAVLLDRSTKPPKLTEDGRSALAYGRKVLLAVDDLSSHLDTKDGPAGEFRLGVAPGFADGVLGAPLDKMMRAFPDLVPRITSGWSGELLTALRADALDAALILATEARTTDETVHLHPFWTDAVSIVAARRTPMPASPRVAELGRHPWILNPVGCGFRAALHRAIDRGQGHLNLCAEVQGYDLQLSLVARGVGLGLVPAARLKASPLGRDLKVISPQDFRLTVTTTIASGMRRHRFNQVVTQLTSEIERLKPKIAKSS